MYTAHLTALDHLLGDGGHHLRSWPARSRRTTLSTRWADARNPRAVSNSVHVKFARGAGARGERIRARSEGHRPPSGHQAPLAGHRDAGVRRAAGGVHRSCSASPTTPIQVFVWLWFGTIAWNIEAPRRYHLRFVRDWSIPMVGAGHLLLQPRPHRRPRAARSTRRSRSASTSGSARRHTCPPSACSTRCAATRACGRATRAGTTSLFTTVYSSHFLTGLTIAAVLWVRNRDEWLRWMRRYVAINFGALAVYIALPDGTAVDGLRGRLHPTPTSPGSPAAAGDDLGLGPLRRAAPGGRQPGRRDAVAACRHHVPGRDVRHRRLRSAVALAARALSRCSCAVALVYYGEHYVVDVLAGAVLAGAGHGRLRLVGAAASA